MTRYIPPNDADFLAWISCRSENAEAARTTRIPPHPSPLPPCSRGERVREWGDSACKKPLRRAEQGWLVYTLIKTTQEKLFFEQPLSSLNDGASYPRSPSERHRVSS
jgi:hypothetical protein